MTRIYLAGPMSGLPDFNYPAFHQAAKQLRGQGFHVENPAENAAPECGSWAAYMRLALRQMLTCNRVVFLPEWEHSKGAQLEYEIAMRLDIPTHRLEDIDPGIILGCRS
jgi:hypothetical protein